MFENFKLVHIDTGAANIRVRIGGRGRRSYFYMGTRRRTSCGIGLLLLSVSDSPWWPRISQDTV